MDRTSNRTHIRELVIQSLARGDANRNPEPTSQSDADVAAATALDRAGGEGYFDFDLAEFPLFRFHKSKRRVEDRNPLCYQDTITGKDGKPVPRQWRVYPGPFGFGGQTTQALLYDLLQLYVEQGCSGCQIQFGTLRSLFLRRGERNPSKADYVRMRRDLDILRGYDIHCQNAFWDRNRQAYVDMKWRLFTEVFFFKGQPGEDGPELPFGFIEVSKTLQQVARARGFFGLGFGNQFFHGLKPLEQRLAVYLAKKFVSQQMHRRFVEDLATALPIEASRSNNQRAVLDRAAKGLVEAGFCLLAAFRLEKTANGRWVAVFTRSAAPQQGYRLARAVAASLLPGVQALVDRIVEATGNAKDRLWWTQCAKRLGAGAVDRALGQLKEATRHGKVRSNGALLTKIFKDIATQTGIALQ